MRETLIRCDCCGEGTAKTWNRVEVALPQHGWVDGYRVQATMTFTVNASDICKDCMLKLVGEALERLRDE